MKTEVLTQTRKRIKLAVTAMEDHIEDMISFTRRFQVKFDFIIRNMYMYLHTHTVYKNSI